MPEYEVIDKATEDLDSLQMINCIKKDISYQVAQPYVEYRNQIGLPYDPPSGLIDVRNLDIKRGDFLILSVGGNDFLNRGELNPPCIVGKYGSVVKIMNFYQEKGLEPSHMFYMTPYPPTKNMKNPGGIDYQVLYKMLNMLAIKMCG